MGVERGIQYTNSRGAFGLFCLGTLWNGVEVSQIRGSFQGFINTYSTVFWGMRGRALLVETPIQGLGFGESPSVAQPSCNVNDFICVRLYSCGSDAAMGSPNETLRAEPKP